MSHEHPQNVPVKICPHFHVFFSPQLSVWCSQPEQNLPVGMWVPPAAPQTCWAVGTHTWGPGRAAQCRISLLPGKRNQAEKREERPGLLAPWRVRAAGFGPCIMQILRDYVKPLCSSSQSRAKSSVGPGQFWGGTSAATQMVTPGLQPLEETCPDSLSHSPYGRFLIAFSSWEPSKDPAASQGLAQLYQGLCSFPELWAVPTCAGKHRECVRPLEHPSMTAGTVQYHRCSAFSHEKCRLGCSSCLAGSPCDTAVPYCHRLCLMQCTHFEGYTEGGGLFDLSMITK